MARVLVVEDDADARDLVVRRVRRLGHRVLAVGDASAALESVVAHGAPDVVLVDVGLPGEDGVTLLHRLRRHTPGLPAVFVTVAWSGDVLSQIRDTGAEHLPKPFTTPMLRRALANVLPGPAGAGERAAGAEA